MENRIVQTIIKLDSLNIEEKIEDVYLYDDGQFSIFYNDEIPLKINLEKTLFRKYKKLKDFYGSVKDIKANLDKDKNLLELIYILYK